MKWRKNATSLVSMMTTTTTATAASSSSSSSVPRFSRSLASSVGMVAPPSRGFFTYGLGSPRSSSSPQSSTSSPTTTLYVPLTGRSNSATLPQTRGPSFVLPPAVVAALCRVRDAEGIVMGGDNDNNNNTKGGKRPQQKWEPWCKWLDTLDESPPQKLPPPLERVTVWPPQELYGREEEEEGETQHGTSSMSWHRPTVEELLQEILPQLLPTLQDDDNEQQHPSSTTITTTNTVVIAGEGEPLLRLSALLRLVRSIKEHSASTKVRITTNGLTDDSGFESIAQSLREAGVDAVSVSVATHDPELYVRLLNPVAPCSTSPEDETQQQTTTTTITAHARVGAFVRASLYVGLDVEATAVEHPDVDRILTEQYVASLGVTHPVRWRSYWP